MSVSLGMLRVAAVAAIVSPLPGTTATAQDTGPARSKESLQQEDEIARIVGYTMTRGGAPTFLETLTDSIGGRITGTPQSLATSELILKALTEAGFANAHYEDYVLASTWQHGMATGEVISPVRRSLTIGSYG